MRTPSQPIDRRTLVMGAAASAAFATVSARAPAADTTAGKVARVKGSAEATGSGAARRLAPPMPIFVADVVQTGADSRLGLQLGADTTLNLGASTRIKIDKFLMNAGGVIDLLDGTILYEHDGPPGREIDFRSPYGLIAVRGTRFYAGPSNGVFGVLVSTGSVVVTGGGKSVTLRAQEGTDMSAPGAAPSDPKPWGLKRIRAMQAAVR